MELLRRIFLISIGCIIFINSGLSQDFNKKKEAFLKSYSEEASGNYPAALNALMSLYDESSYELNLRIGWLNYLAGNLTESKIYYSKAVALMPYSVEAKMGLVYPLAALGNMNEVTSQYEEILKIVPNYSVVLHRMGLIYYGRGEFDNALKYFDKVVNLWPFDYDGLTMLGWTYFKLNNPREAKVLFQKAILNTPDGALALEGLNLLK